MCNKKKTEQDEILSFLHETLPAITGKIASKLKNPLLGADDLTGIAYEIYCEGEFDNICLENKSRASGYIASTLRNVALSGQGIHYRSGISTPYIADKDKDKRLYPESFNYLTEVETDSILSDGSDYSIRLCNEEFEESIFKDPFKYPLSIAIIVLGIEAFEFTPYALKQEANNKSRGGRYSKNTAHYIIPHELSLTLQNEQRQNSYSNFLAKKENLELIRRVFINQISSRKLQENCFDPKTNILNHESNIKNNLKSKLGFTAEEAHKYWLWLESFIRKLKNKIRLAKNN